MEECGAGLYIEDAELSAQKLLDLIYSLTNNNEKLCRIQQNALKMAKYDGVQKIVEQIENAVK